MKYVVLILSACVVAGALAVPASSQGDAASERSVSGRIRELVESHSDLVQGFNVAHAESLTKSALEDAQRIDEELERAVQQLDKRHRSYSSGPSGNDVSNKSEWIRRRISEIRSAITAATAELASTVWEQAQGGKVSESLILAHEKVVKRLAELKDELLMWLRELLIPDDDVPVPSMYVVDEIFEQIIANSRAQMADALAVIADWHNLLSDSGRQRVAAAKKRLTELVRQISETIDEWRRGSESTSTTASAHYGLLRLKDPLQEEKNHIEADTREA